MKKRVHEMELNRSSVQMVLAERFPGYSRASDFNSVISDPQDIMVRGNEESFMEHGFGVAGLNGCRSIMCAISSDGTACYSGECACIYRGRDREVPVNGSGNTG